MQYRDFGTLDWKGSALGFGCMRLPSLDGQRNSGNIDDPEAIRMIRHAIDNGVNYLDTAYVYHDGKSEVLLGNALSDGYRDRVKIATKLPTWLVKGPNDFDRYLDDQLRRLQTDRIDFYLFHALNKDVWSDVVLRHDLLKKAEAALTDGRIGHLGFSFHGDYAAFYEIVNGSDLWSMCQIQYSYMDTDNQAGTRGLHLAEHKKLAVVVMEPLLGGRLADPPEDIRALIEDYPIQRTAAEWAFQWLWDQAEVSIVLSGMSNMLQVEQNLHFADESRIGYFSPAETELISEIRARYMARNVVPCTRCGYCLPCPNGIDIPGNLELFNYAHTYNDTLTAKFRYKVVMKEAEQATARAAGAASRSVRRR